MNRSEEWRAIAIRVLSDTAISSALQPYGVSVSAALASTVRRYIELLRLWNEKVNLTGINQPERVLERHFGEAFFAAKALRMSNGRLVDIGSGAGFPALAIKILVPEMSVTLVEVNLKRAAFLLEVCRAIPIAGVEVKAFRFQELTLELETADYVTSRAVGRHEELLSWARPALNPRGSVVLWLGSSDARRIMGTDGWQWQEPIPIPKSRERVLLAGTPQAFNHSEDSVALNPE